MTGGYTGKILRVNLTKKSIGILDTEQYEEYGLGTFNDVVVFNVQRANVSTCNG